ncbi:MAG: histidinol-phosphatase, partial [Beijerinckiaceae bacterium]|nr:histidinol-phosphatase [Beijerinckiaceae bacterium]
MKPVDFSAFVEDLARVSADAILPFFRSSMHTSDKSNGGAFDPVTEADRAAETAMRRLILRELPGHGII